MNWITRVVAAVRNFWNRVFGKKEYTTPETITAAKKVDIPAKETEILHITEKLLTKNEFSRPGKMLKEVKGIILHWVGAPMQRANATWTWFEQNCPKEGHYSSAHYIIDLNGEVIRAIPDNEVAYHCGSSQPDPASGKIYTDWAREHFGDYAANPTGNSPNNCTIGIEMCIIDDNGNFTAETYEAAARLTAKLIKENKLLISDIGTHKAIVGWKDCPMLWSRSPALLNEFKEKVKQLIV